jgi:hypothetical protein
VTGHPAPPNLAYKPPKMLSAADLVLALPAGWSEFAHPDGLRELRAGVDGEGGILQVSRFEAEAAGFVLAQSHLGALAAEMGKQLDEKGGGWGSPVRKTETTCTLGRLGVAVFADGSFPAMLLLVTAADARGAAWMWTFLGPSLTASELEQAMGIVTGASLG